MARIADPAAPQQKQRSASFSLGSDTCRPLPLNMIYFLYGKDGIRSRKKLHELLDFAKKKRPEAEVFRFTSENWEEGKLDELLSSQGLFDQKYTVVLDSLFEKKDIKSFVVEKLSDMAESEQLFFMIESAVDAPTLKKIEKVAKQVQEFQEKIEKKEEKNIFSVANGLVERDKKKLWMNYLDFIENGYAPEELHGIFFWQVKNMIIASLSQKQNETGLSPFAYTNALRGSRNYKTEELQKMSNDLVELTHKVRTGKGELGIMLEKWVLGV